MQYLIAAPSQFFFPVAIHCLNSGLIVGGESEIVVKTAKCAVSLFTLSLCSSFLFRSLPYFLVSLPHIQLGTRMRRLGKVLSTMASDVVRDGVFGRHCLPMR